MFGVAFRINSSDVRNIAFTYTNYKGETEKRRARFIEFRFGTSQWHAEDQWLMKAFDLDKKEIREFAMNDMKDVGELL